MAQGTSARVTDRGFGFIQQERGGEDLFFHTAALQDGACEDLRRGDRVEYTEEPDARGARPQDRPLGVGQAARGRRPRVQARAGWRGGGGMGRIAVARSGTPQAGPAGRTRRAKDG